MDREDASRLLDRIGGVQHACDLDLLVFFARHPRTLLTSEQLATWLGYELKQIAASLEVLLQSGLLTRTQNPTHAARMYIFVAGPSSDNWVPTLIKLASSRAGRLALKEELSGRGSQDADGPVGRDAREGRAATRPRPFVVRRTSKETSAAKAG